MRRATILSIAAAFLFAGSAFSQELEYTFSPEGDDLSDPFAAGSQNGARGLSGPFDLDNDGNIEILVAQHSAGGRVHVIENQGEDDWQLVYSTPFMDSTDNSFNARYATGADLDGDGRGEIVYVAGNGYSGTDPALTIGAYVWEYDGQGSDNYGDYPATIGNFYEVDGLSQSATYAQKLNAIDIDDDGQQELLVPANGDADHDVFYVLSVTGDYETGGAAGTFATWNIESRQNPRDDAEIWGGGSPIDMLPGDFNGDGQMDISYHSWNSFNFFNGTAAGTDEILLPDAETPNSNIQATAEDHVALFGGTVADIDGDGNDEAFYPNFQTSNLAVMDYDEDEDVLSITSEELVINVVEGTGWGGIAAGDLDGDGAMDLMIGASGYSAEAYMNDEPSQFLNVAEFLGGDPTDPANWTLDAIDTGHPIDSTGFNIIHRDSLGEMTTYYETAASKQGTLGSGGDPVFPSGVAFLGDADGDGMHEVALSFQGVDDSLQVIDEVYNEDTNIFERTTREVFAPAARPFVRIYEFSADFSVAIDDEAGIPDGFDLQANYPNPFNPTTTIGFSVPDRTPVTLRVYDATGRVVSTLINDRAYGAGTYEVQWDGRSMTGRSVASGTYFYSLEFEGQKIVKPMVLVK